MKLAPRPWLDVIQPYLPGKHAASSAGSLASNESPLGASPAVRTAVAAALQRAHRYPDPLADELRAELAALHHVDAEQILVGNGSDELIYLLAWAFLAQSGHAVCADPAYRIDEISSYVVGARLTKVPLRDRRHDLAAMAAVDADVAYVVNPHNPTGTVRTRAEIEEFVATNRAGLVVVDEAYVEFADDPGSLTAMPLVDTGRVAVLRTFSKIYGLAGLRVGYLVTEPGVIATLRKIRAPFSVGAIAQAAAVAALHDPGHATRVREHALAGRKTVTELFEAAGYRVVPSQANFVLVEAADEAALVERLARCGVSVRPGRTLGVPGAVRVSVPSDEGLRMLERALGPELDRLPATAERA